MNKTIKHRFSKRPLFILTKPNKFSVGGYARRSSGGLNTAPAISEYATDISGQLGNLSQIHSQNINKQNEDLANINALSSNEDILNNFNSFGYFDKANRDNYTIDTSLDFARQASANAGKGITTSAVSTGASLGSAAGSIFGPIGTGVGALVGGLGGLLFGKSKKKKIQNQAALQTQQANQHNQNLLNSNIANINTQSEEFKARTSKDLYNQINNIENRNMNNMLSNYAAYGGYFPSIDTYAQTGDIYLRKYKDGGKLSNKQTKPSSELVEINGMYYRNGKLVGEAPLRRVDPIFDLLTLATSSAMSSAKAISKGLKHLVLNKGINLSKTKSLRRQGAETVAKELGKTFFSNGGSINTTHQFGIGGNLNSNVSDSSTHGANFSNEVTSINNGGKHEDNPLGGVPISIGENGKTNMVEEGEVKYKDYIFSDRFSPNKKDLKELKMSEKLNKSSFAKLAEKSSKESSERPNDPISKRGLEASLDKLRVLQDMEKERKNPTQDNMFKWGGTTGSLTSKSPSLSNFNVPDLPKFTNSPQQVSKGLFSGALDALSSLGSMGSIGGIASNLLRLAPVIGSGIAASKEPKRLNFEANYTPAENVSKGLKGVSYTPIGNYMTYNPLDTQRDINTLNSIAGANRASIAQSSGGNKGQYIAGVLASDKMALDKLGDIRRAATESDIAQKAQVESFNRGTNMANSEMALKANEINSSNSLRASLAAAELRQNAFDTARALNYKEYLNAQAAKGANMTNFLDNLGSLGKELATRNSINTNDAYKYTNSLFGTKYKNNKTK